MNTKALKDMRAMLKEIKDEKWTPSLDKPGVEGWLNGFGDHQGFYIGSWGEELYGLHEPCGFTACAIGHAALDGRFPEFTALAYNGEMLVSVEGHTNHRYIMPALAKYFGIEEMQAQRLFLGDYYEGGSGEVTPDHVIYRINLLLNLEEDA